MYLKPIKYLLLALIFTSMATSCQKWLDVRPITQLTNEDLFKDENGFAQALTGVYSLMSNTNLYGREMTFGTIDILAGYYQPSSGGNNTYLLLYNSFPYKRTDPNKHDPSVAIIDGMWSGMYNAIVNVNNILQELNSSTIDFSGDNKKILRGEALGLRAYLHFDLLRMYGPSYAVDRAAPSIPFVDTLAAIVARTESVEQINNRIIADLEEAVKLMENDPIKLGLAPSSVLAPTRPVATLAVYHNRRYRFNYYAAAATLARAYQWKGDKTNALKYAKIVIAVQNERFPWVDFDRYVDNINTPSSPDKDRTFTTEHIFALNIRALEDYIPSHFAMASREFSTRLITPSALRDAIYEGLAGDYRYNFLFSPIASPDYMSTKYYQDEVVPTWFKHQLPLIRISEMYYIASESEPNFQDGLAWINMVRQARKIATPLVASSINTPALLQAEIQKEYQKEFIAEGQLWFYYKRHHSGQLLPITRTLSNKALYVFDLPEDELVFGGR